MTDKIILTEDQIINAFQTWLMETDADELARVTGELFGGTCFAYGDGFDNCEYEFEPDENYAGAFDK